MTTLVIKDLPKSEEMDSKAMAKVAGGIIGGCTELNPTNVNTMIQSIASQLRDIGHGARCY
ncbi:hypothetical protein AWB77_01808 [Caballeronia fortuita]|uniref:Uncharacterized protein n=1 Tax=Caballeronia fortuita TaxID=1777138 RepID=A0A158AHH7_9BURK|nr:hypothetical protein [Caballeronia fortuita]SAK57268.1 hypothetical protein AWB77_01808 [Caballeronia fortuita]